VTDKRNDLDSLITRISILEALAEEAKEERKEIKDLLSLLKAKFDRWEGKFGGVLFVIACLWAFFSGFAKAAVSWITLTGGGK
jgi:hypothetical protein